MPIPGFDFGLFIAYALPSALTLYALSLLSSPLRDFLRPNIAQPSVGATLIIAALALAAGRVISVGRAGFIDHTFRVGLPFVTCNGAPALGAIKPVDQTTVNSQMAAVATHTCSRWQTSNVTISSVATWCWHCCGA
jgi:hypothetical protein